MNADGLVYGVLADIVGIGHGALVIFIIGGQLLIMAGWWRGWGWTRQRQWRLGHLGAVVLITVIDGIGFMCPLTTMEWKLRKLAGEGDYKGGFIEHWINTLLYYDWPDWVFALLYGVFAVAVMITYWFYPPKKYEEK